MYDGGVDGGGGEKDDDDIYKQSLHCFIAVWLLVVEICPLIK